VASLQKKLEKMTGAGAVSSSHGFSRPRLTINIYLQEYLFLNIRSVLWKFRLEWKTPKIPHDTAVFFSILLDGCLGWTKAECSRMFSCAKSYLLRIYGYGLKYVMFKTENARLKPLSRLILQMGGQAVISNFI
jgi:hypothetical protein